MNPANNAALDAYFKAQVLDVPFIPNGYERRIKKVEENVFGSIASDKPLYDLNAFLGELLTKPVQDYVLTGLAEQGVNGRAICYYAVQGPLALFIQLPFAQAMGGNLAEERKRINNAFQAARDLFAQYEKNSDKIAPGKRMLVVMSDFRGSGCQWIDGQPGKIDEEKWLKEWPPLFQARVELSKLAK